MIEINKNPSKKELLIFGLLLLLFSGFVGALFSFRWGRPAVGQYVWFGGAALALLHFAIPPLRKPLFLTWMYLAFPIGWTVSHLLLGLIYYGVLTPVGLLLWLFGHDSMHRKMEPERDSYWIEHRSHRDSKSYFRQF